MNNIIMESIVEEMDTSGMNQYALKVGEMVSFSCNEECYISSLIDMCILTIAGTYCVTGNIVSYADYDIDIAGEILIPSSDIIQPVNYSFTCLDHQSFYLTITNTLSLNPECNVLSYNLSIIRLV